MREDGLMWIILWHRDGFWWICGLIWIFYDIRVGSGRISGLMWILFEVRWINVDIFLGEAGGCGFLWVRSEDSGWISGLMWIFMA